MVEEGLKKNELKLLKWRCLMRKEIKVKNKRPGRHRFRYMRVKKGKRQLLNIQRLVKTKRNQGSKMTSMEERV